MNRLLSVAAATVLMGQGAALAQDLEARGKELVEQNCSRCHGIGATGASPHPVAPPFRELADRWPLEQLEEALAEGMVTGHPDMPEFIFSPEDIQALLAYLAAISKP